MITISTELGPVLIAQSLTELPSLPEVVQDLYLDVETTSFNPKQEAFLPYNGHRVAGIALTWDDAPVAWYIPIRHTDEHWNLPVVEVIEWLKCEVKKAKRWRNHNIKFDAHCLLQDGFEWEGEWNCSLTEVKMHDSDRLTHGLKSVCRDLVSLPMEEEREVQAFLKGCKSKNYGDVPADILGKYAGMDVLGNRALCGFLDARLPSTLDLLRRQESLLTPVLFDCERAGLRADRNKVRIEAILTSRRLINLATRITELTGREFTGSNKNLFEVLIVQLGLPILVYKRKKDDDGQWKVGNPTFDSDALKLYGVHEAVLSNPLAKELVDLIVKYRTESTFYGLFLSKYMELADAEFHLHPMYNQAVRSGRMSCSNPNGQQLNKRAKRLIIPRDGEAMLSADASQIEFRIIVHYIEDDAAIAAYRDNPDTDFHQWAADLAGMKRSEGKILNFAVAFGAGEKKVAAELAASPGVIAMVMQELGEGATEAEFYRRCRQRAGEIYRIYHDRLPGIKRVSWEAQCVAKTRGYVFNLFGRRRHLPRNVARKAFNTIVQGSASDLVKSLMIKLAPRYNDYMRRLGVRIIAQVHDEILFAGPRHVLSDSGFHFWLNQQLEEIPHIKLSVPIRWQLGYSETSWANACSDNPIVIEETGVSEGRIKIAS